MLALNEKYNTLETGDEKDSMNEELSLLSVEAFRASAELCEVVLIHHNEKYTKEFLLEKTTLPQLTKLISIVSDAIMGSMDSGVSNSGKVKEEPK